MSDITIAPGTALDLPDVMTIMAQAFDARYGEAWTKSQCLALLSMPGATLLIARGTRPLGFALMRTIAEECELMMIGVLPHAQSRGIGARLLGRVVESAAANGARAIFLEVRKGNRAAEFYRRSDFECVGFRARYYRSFGGELFDAQTFRRVLI